MNYKLGAIILVIVGVVSAGVTRYYFPKVEYKNVEVTKEVVKTDIQTIVKEIIKPDGTKETVTQIVDHSEKTEIAKKEVIVAEKNKYLLGLGVRAKLDDRTIIYDLEVQKRVAGPFFVGVKLGTDKSIGLGLTMEF